MERAAWRTWPALFVAACATAGGLPGWVNDPYHDYPKDRYVVAVGSGRNFDAARRDAMKGIAAFLGVEITSQSGVHERATAEGKDGRAAGGTSHLEADESVSQIISGHLSSVAIEKAHSAGDTTYVLALLDKGVFLAGLAEEADNAARALGEGVKAAGAQGTPSENMLGNLQATAQRLEALQGRIIALGGSASPTASVTLKNAVAFLARFDIRVAVPRAPAAGGAAQGPLCDQADPRLRKAVADTAAIVGHAVAFHFNLDQLPKSPTFCDDLFERHIGLLPKDLESMKERAPAPFAYGAPTLKLVDFDYDGTAQYAALDYDRKTGRLHIVMTGRTGWPIPSDAVSHVFEKDYQAWVVGHFEGAEPEKVVSSEWPLYFDYLTRLLYWDKTRPRKPRSERNPLDDVAEDAKAEATGKMVRFAPLVASDAGLAGKVRDWLAERFELFGMDYLHHPAEVQKAPAGSPFKKAERAWIDWMNGAFDGLPDEKKKKLLPEMMSFTMPFNNDEGIVWNEWAYPGLRTYEMGLRIIDRWRAAGHPTPTSRNRSEAEQGLYDEVASPIKRNSQGYRSVENFERRKNWYFHAMRTEELKKRLLADLLARKDDVLTETAFANFMAVNIHMHGNYGQDRKDDWRDFLFFWRGIEADERQWKVATRVVAEAELQGESKRALYDESMKIWRGSPRLRGSLLYLLSLTARYEHNLIPWNEWARVAGAPVGPKELGDFLDMGFRAVAALPYIWPALGKGYSRGELLVARLDKFIDEPLTRANNFQDPGQSIGEILHKLHEDGAGADVAKLHAFLKKRVADHPSEEREYRTLIEMSGR